MYALTPLNPIQKHIAAETERTLSHPLTFSGSEQSATILVCRSRGGVGASTLSSTIFCLAGAERKGTFIECAGMTGYAHRAHKGARFHIQNTTDMVIAEILDIRINRLDELTIIEFEPGLLHGVDEIYRKLEATLARPVYIIYVADENEEDPRIVQHLARAGLPVPLIVTKPTGAMQKSSMFVTLPRLTGDIKSSFFQRHSTLSEAIATSTQQGSKLMLNSELRAFRLQLEEYCRG